jgi:aminopeptidase N
MNTTHKIIYNETLKTTLWVIPIALAAGFVGSSVGAPQPPLDGRTAAATAPALSRYSLDVRLDPALHRITATARIGITGGTNPRSLTFLLNRQLTVTSVRSGGKPASFSHGPPNQEAKPLLVELDQPSLNRDREVVIEYHGTIPPPGAQDPDWMGALVIRSNEVRMTEQTKWYPMMNGQRAPFEASIDLPGDFALIWPDRSRKTTHAGGRTTWKVACTNPAAPALIAGIYAAENEPPVGVYLFQESAGEAEAVLQQAREILAFLESRFGPRPFDQLSICQMRVLNSRFSYNFAVPGAVVLPTEIIRMARRTDRKEFWTRKLAHEIAHQWWGCSVDLPRDPWRLNESLAELSAALYLQSLQRDKSLGDFLSAEAKEIRLLSSLARRGEPPNEKQYRNCLAYQKGPWVLAMLRDVLGEEAFDNTLRSFYARHAFRQATQDDFQKSFGTCETISLETFFKQWIDRPVLPRITVEALPSDESSKGIVLRLDQTEPVFRLPVEFRITTAAGSVITSCLLTQARQQIETRIQGPLLYLEVDPGGKLLLESQMDTNFLVQNLIQAKTVYESLLAAHRADQPAALDSCASDLRDTFRWFSTALEIEQHRARLAGRQPLDARTKLRLEECEQLKLAIESFFGNAGKTADLRGLVRDIAESADEIHDGVRDKQPDTIAPHLTKLTQAWGQFSHHVRTCSQIGY